MHSPESTTSGLGIALRGGNGVVLPLRAWARASVYLLVGGIERKASRYRIQLRIPESREEGKYDRIFFIAFPVAHRGSKRIRL